MFYNPTDFDRFLKASSDNSFTFDNYSDRGERKIHSALELQFESVRLKTFYYFKNEKNRAEVKDLARDGFFYNRFYDCILCTFCGNKIHPDHNYRAATAHRTIHCCPLNKFPLHGNVPQVRPDCDDNLSKINYMLQEYMSFKVKHAVPHERNKIFFHERFQFSRNSNLADYAVRLSSFRYFLHYLPPNKRPNVERLAEAGFVCTGFTDIVVCFNCKGGMFNIDVDDDPIKDHIKFYGHCTFIKNYCTEHGMEIEHIPKPLSEAMFTEDEQDLLMEHPLIEHLISKGYDKTVVRKKAVEYVFCFGCFPYDIKECISMAQSNNT